MEKPKVWNRRDKNCPKDAVYVGRPSRWGNPFRVKEEKFRQASINLFREYAIKQLEKDPNWLKPLQGKDLVCWCAPLPCHADVLLELANNEAITFKREEK